MTDRRRAELGRQAVIHDLTKHGFTIIDGGSAETETQDLRARNGDDVNVLIQIRTSIAPAQPPLLTPDQLRGLIHRAIYIDGKAFICRVVLDGSGAVVKAEQERVA